MVKDAILDYGTPEEEAYRWKILPLYLRYQTKTDSYFYKVKYYDKPEGEDLIGKMIATNRTLFPIGLSYGIVDAFMHQSSSMSGFQARAGRVLHFTWPAVGVATAFTSTVYFATKMRGEFDGWNYALGSIAAGSVVGAWQKCHITGWAASLFFCIASYAQTIRNENGIKWLTLNEQRPGDHRWHKNQWDLFTDPLPKNYSTTTTSGVTSK